MKRIKFSTLVKQLGIPWQVSPNKKNPGWDADLPAIQNPAAVLCIHTDGHTADWGDKTGFVDLWAVVEFPKPLPEGEIYVVGIKPGLIARHKSNGQNTVGIWRCQHRDEKDWYSRKRCAGVVVYRTYAEMAEAGSPLCPVCDDEMEFTGETYAI